MIILTEEQHDLPLVDVQVVILTGSSADPVGKEGLARHAATLMRRGAGGRTRSEVDEAFDALGASLEIQVSPDSVTFSAHCLSRNLEPLMALLGELLVRPTFREEEHEKLRRETKALLVDIRDDDDLLCARHFERVALCSHPYGRSALGTSRSIESLDLRSAVDWFANHVKKDNVVVGFAGDIDEAKARELTSVTLDDLKGASVSSRPPLGDPKGRSGRRAVLVDKPERVQAQVLIGHPIIRTAHPDWIPLQVGATVFGGMFTSRLMTEVRVKRGWSYGAGCRLPQARAGHAFRIKVFPASEQAGPCIALVFSLWESITKAGVTRDELELAKKYLVGTWAFEVDTAAKRLDRRIDTIVMDLPEDTFARYTEHVARVTLAEACDAMRTWWKPEDAATVIVATADDLLPALQDVPVGDIEVVPFDRD
ncbi:MAG: insulinase family protein [Deltaproteobacteria bacterium]|nr:insulinase family protein [Deltaproteobacteria bacterium]